MIFNSLTFLLFLIIVLVLFWILPKKARILMLFLSSLIFYGFWRWEFVGLMLFSAVVDYWASIQIEETPIENKKKRFQYLSISLILNLGLLMYFKYLYFFTENVNSVFRSIGTDFSLPLMKVILPLGISFYTFQTISYTIDVYRGHLKAERNFFLFGAFVTFFPQLVAGPILRASEIMDQLNSRVKFSFSFIHEGVQRMLYGLFLKVVLADNIGNFVNDGFAITPSSVSAIDTIVLSFLFGFQIYFDFAGYSHIAIGCAKLMGIDFPENFNFPYAARSFKEFWKRWHISLSSWIRDYLYLPLTGVKVNASKRSTGGIDVAAIKETSQRNKNLALFATWSIMGLWHGANWTFVLWGVIHACFIFVERKLGGFRKRFPFFSIPVVSWCVTFPLAMLSWIPFRANNLTDVFTYYGKLFSLSNYTFLAMRENVYIVTFLVTILFIITYLLDRYVWPFIKEKPLYYYPVYFVQTAVLFFFVFTFFRPISQYIYFQF